VAWPPYLTRLTEQSAFDKFHHRLVLRTARILGRTSRRRRLSYDQAQKPINVFLKVYVDWAKLPNRSCAARVSPLLHVPLDSILMDRVRREHRELHEQIVAPAYRRADEWPSDLRLAIVNRHMYLSWRGCSVGSDPIGLFDLDVIWLRAPRT